MRLKLDENLGRRAAEALERAGHDVATVVGQQMPSASDLVLIEACRDEGRCLLTMDLDFANPFRFDPTARPGIAVLRPRGANSVLSIGDVVQTFVRALEHRGVHGRLWIVEFDGIREYAPESKGRV